jgi:hypothetical protein
VHQDVSQQGIVINRKVYVTGRLAAILSQTEDNTIVLLFDFSGVSIIKFDQS